MNTVKLKHTKIDVKMLKEKCPLPDLLRRIGLGKHAKPSCPSPFRSDSKPSWGIFQRDGTGTSRILPRMRLEMRLACWPDT